jgi:hypothetical protein
MGATWLGPLRRILVRLWREGCRRSRARGRFTANGAELYTTQSGASDKNEIHRQRCGPAALTSFSRSNDGSAKREQKIIAEIPHVPRGIAACQGAGVGVRREMEFQTLHGGPRFSSSCRALGGRAFEPGDSRFSFDERRAKSVTAQVFSNRPASSNSAAT